MDNMRENRITQGLRCYSLNDILEEAPKIEQDRGAAVLSISSTNSPQPLISELGMTGRGEDVMYLVFDDIGCEHEVDSDLKLEYFGLTIEQAEKFLEWFEQRKEQGKNFYIHCEAGLSRSQGFIRFILDCYPEITWLLRMSNPCMYPNFYVVSTLKDAWRKKYMPELYENPE